MLPSFKHVTILFLLLSPACAYAETTVALTTTVHAAATPAEKQLAANLLALLEIETNQYPEIQVVERQQLDLALHELVLSNSNAPKTRLQLGKLANANLILTAKLLEPNATGKQHVDVRITESLTGKIRGATRALIEPSTVDETVLEIAQYLTAVLTSPKLSGTSVSVAPFESLGRFDRLRPLERGLRDMVVAWLRNYEGLQVLQRSEMKQLLAEIDLIRAGLVDRQDLPATLPSRAAAYHLRGTIDESQIGNARQLIVTMELIHASSQQTLATTILKVKPEGLSTELPKKVQSLVDALAKRTNIRSPARKKPAQRNEIDELFRRAIGDLRHFGRRNPRDFGWHEFRLPDFKFGPRTYRWNVQIDSTLGIALIRKSVDRLESVLYLEPDRREAQFALAWCFCCHVDGLWQPRRAEKLLRNVFEANRQDALSATALDLLAEMYFHHDGGRCKPDDRKAAWEQVFFAFKHMPASHRDYQWMCIAGLHTKLRGFTTSPKPTTRFLEVIAPIIDSGTGKEFSMLAAIAVTMAHQVAEADDHPQLREEAQNMLARWRESEIPALLVADLGYQANRAVRKGDHLAAADLFLQRAKLLEPTTDRPSIRPQHSALLRAARAYRDAGQAEQALKLLRSFEPQEDTPSTVLKGRYNVEVGKTLEVLGRKDEALETYVAGAKKGRGLVDNSNVAQLIKKLGGVPLDPDREIDVVYLDNKAGKPFHCRSVATDGHQIFVAGDYRLPWRTNGVSTYHPVHRTWENLGGPTSRVSCLTYDDEYLWVGTDEQGLWRCDLATTTWKQWEDLPDKRVVDILIHDGDAYVSVGSANSGGMLRIKAEKLVSGDSVHVYQAAGAPTGTLRHLTTDGKKIYGVNQSLYELDLKTDQWHRPISQTTGRPIHSAFVYCGASGLWGSHYGQELFQIGATPEKNQRFSKAWFPSGQGKAGYSVAFAAERNGQIWFAGFPWERFKSSGLYRLDLETGEFKMFSPRDGFRTGGLYRCYDGVWLGERLWLATSDGLAEVAMRDPTERDSKTPVEEFAETIKPFVPEGWTVSVAGKSIALRRKEKVLWVPLYGRPPGNADETYDEYLRRIGILVTLDIDLRFMPRMTDAEYKKLSGLHSAVVEQGKNGFQGKIGSLPAPSFTRKTQTANLFHGRPHDFCRRRAAEVHNAR